MARNGIEVHVAPRRVRWGRLSSLLVCVIVAGGILVWQVAMQAGNGRAGGSGNAAAPVGSPVSLTPPVPLAARYNENVKERVAQGLHLTVAQVTAQLRAEPAPDLREIAKEQGIAQDQLYRLVRSALQAADDQMVTSGVWIQRQADEEEQYWSQQGQLPLISGVASWFLLH